MNDKQEGSLTQGTENEAQASGAYLYTLPSDLVPEQIDPLLRDAVFAINRSGWLFTGESCQGHPDETDIAAPWGFNTDVYLRMVCKAQHLGTALTAMLWAARDESQDLMGSCPMEFFTRELKNDWLELKVYVRCKNAAQRNRGCRALAKFGERIAQPDYAAEKAKYEPTIPTAELLGAVLP